MIKFCSLYSGSSGNCLFVGYNDTKILIDAGLSGVAIERALKQIDEDPKEISAILVTHDHSDHVQGIGILSKRYDIPIYANEGTWAQVSLVTQKVDDKNKKLFKANESLEIGRFGVIPFSIPHDAAEPVAFSFIAEGKKITTATDIGHVTNGLLKKFQGSDLLFLESNHDINMLNAGRYPYKLKRRILGNKGHLSNEMCSKVVCYLAGLGMTRFILGHLSNENNYPLLAYETTNSALLEKGINAGRDVYLEVASRDKAGKGVYL